MSYGKSSDVFGNKKDDSFKGSIGAIYQTFAGQEGWAYLASVTDLCSRKTIGYAYGASISAELVTDAVRSVWRNVRKFNLAEVLLDDVIM